MQAVKSFFDYWEKNGVKENIGALGCNLLDSEGNINSSYATFPDINKNIRNLLRVNYGLWKQLIKKLFSIPISATSKTKDFYEKKLGDVDFIVGQFYL